VAAGAGIGKPAGAGGAGSEIAEPPSSSSFASFYLPGPLKSVSVYAKL